MSEANIEENAGSPVPTPPPDTPVSAASTLKEPDHLRRALIYWVVLSIVGIVIWNIVAPFILPAAASDLDSTDNFTIIMLTTLAIPVALFVFVFLLYSLIVFRVKERPTEDGFHLKPRPLLQVGWLGITSVLCLFLLIWGMFAFYQETAASASSPVVVQVTGQQWMWTFNYPQFSATSQGQVIELPVNRPVIFSVTSKDVLHGFAIRDLGIRVDANPGEITTTPVTTPTQIGHYTVVCVELCGLYHSYMWEAVNVVSASDFSTWITNQGGHV